MTTWSAIEALQLYHKYPSNHMELRRGGLMENRWSAVTGWYETNRHLTKIPPQCCCGVGEKVKTESSQAVRFLTTTAAAAEEIISHTQASIY